MLERLSEALANENGRIKAYAVVAGTYFVLAILVVLMKGGFNFVVSDGRGYYVYLPSVIVRAIA